MAAVSQIQNLKAVFKQGDHVAAKRRLSRLQLHQPGNITTEFKLISNGEPSTDVTLLHLAAYHGWLDIIRTVGFTTTYNCKDNNGRTPLVYAAAGGNISVIDYLITEQDCDPTIPYSDGTLALHIACLHGHLNVTKYFITEQNCDPTSQNQNGRTPLHYASQGGHMNIIQYLNTEQHCDPKIPSNFGSLPLHFACHNGHLNVTKYFITEEKCDPTSQDQDGRTPLNSLCFYRWSYEHHPIPYCRTTL